MRTKLLRKIRKEYKILYYPQGSKNKGCWFENTPHFRPIRIETPLNLLRAAVGMKLVHDLGRTEKRNDAYDLVLHSFRLRYGKKLKKKYKPKSLW